MLFGVDFCWALFWPIQAVSVAREPLCDLVTPLLSPSKSTEGDLMKIEWLVARVIAGTALGAGANVRACELETPCSNPCRGCDSRPFPF